MKMNFASMWQQLSEQVQNGDIKALARAISLIENHADGVSEFLRSFPETNSGRMVGITGPPGAGKSTITDCLIALYAEKMRVAVVCIDPSSPFHHGALLGDRIRMNRWHDHPNVFIRSLANHGTLGGVHPSLKEICQLLKFAGYEMIIIETVGVGQNEVDIAKIADVTVVVLVPEAGDEIQNMKSGLMEIADIFVVNKGDRPESDAFTHNLRQMLSHGSGKGKDVQVIKTNAMMNEGIDELKQQIEIKCKTHS